MKTLFRNLSPVTNVTTTIMLLLLFFAAGCGPSATLGTAQPDGEQTTEERVIPPDNMPPRPDGYATYRDDKWKFAVHIPDGFTPEMSSSYPDTDRYRETVKFTGNSGEFIDIEIWEKLEGVSSYDDWVARSNEGAGPRAWTSEHEWQSPNGYRVYAYSTNEFGADSFYHAIVLPESGRYAFVISDESTSTPWPGMRPFGKVKNVVESLTVIE